MAYQVFDDMFPKSLVAEIEETFTKFQFDWHFTENSSGGAHLFGSDPLTKDCPQMVHLIYNSKAGQIYNKDWVSEYSPIVQTMLDVLQDKTETKIKSIHRIKANLTVPDGTSNMHYNVPHQDHEDKNFLSMVYYVQDADGDTVLFDKHTITNEKMEIVGKVQPSRGRCVIFPSTQFHSSSNPIMFQSRIILNFIFEV